MRYNQPYGNEDPDAVFVNGDPSQGIKGSIIPAEQVEFTQREIVGVIAKAGFTPDNDDQLQLTRGVRQGVNYVAASFIAGAENDYYVSLDPKLDAYRAGLVLRIRIPVNNTGASTLRVDDLGGRSIHRANGAVTTADDLVTGMVVELVYDGAAWQIVNFMGIGGTGTGGDVNTYIVNIPYVIDTGTPNHINAPFVPPITALVPGLLILVKMGPGNTNTTKVDIKVNTLAIVPVIRCDLRPLGPGDLIPGQITCLVFDGVQFQMISMVASTPKIMTGPMAYYVNDSTGSDTLNDGLTAATPFKTVMHALQEMNTWTNKGYVFSIYVADGNYAPFNNAAINGAGSCALIGNSQFPWNVTVTNNLPGSDQSCIVLATGNYTISGFRVTSNSGNGLVMVAGVSCGFGNIDFGYCGSAHLQAWDNPSIGMGFANQSAYIHVSGSAYYHMLIARGAQMNVSTGYGSSQLVLSIRTQISVTWWTNVSGNAHVNEYYSAIDQWNSVVSGTKFAVQENGVLSVGGRGIEYLPGPYPGMTGSGGQYT